MRRKRYTPDRSRTVFRDTPQKREILELLAQYKYLRSTLLIRLTKRSRTTLNDSLRSLFDEGLITKPKEQLRGYNSLSSPDIYMLTPKGERFLVERGKDPLTITRLYRQETDGPIKNFAHAMMICDTLASIHAGALKEDIEFIPWSAIVARSEHENPMKLPFAITHEGMARRDHVIPDGLFGLRYPDGKAAFFILECERFNPIEPTTLDRASFLKKFLAYKDVHKTGVYKDQLKIPNVRVLVVAPNPTKISNMIALSERLGCPKNLFMFTDVPVQEDTMKAPPPMPELFSEEWRLVNGETASLYKKATPENEGRGREELVTEPR